MNPETPIVPGTVRTTKRNLTFVGFATCHTGRLRGLVGLVNISSSAGGAVLPREDGDVNELPDALVLLD